jgi:hypothetical protein
MGSRHDPTRPARVIHAYTVQHLTCQEIGTLEGITRGAIAKILKTHGISSAQGERVTVKCGTCNKEFEVLRKRWRRTNMLFCSTACYYAKRANPAYVQNRNGQRNARKAVMAAGWPLLKGQVVHHHDGNNKNNAVENLAVFESQREHMRFHHYGDAAPVWDGRQAETHA